MHLAQINVGRPLYPLDDPRIAEFIDNLDAVNALAERSPGFVWRLQDDSGNATQISAYEDPTIILNMSVWASPEALYEFAYKTVHRRFVQRRKEWFELFGAQYLSLWWVEEGHRPEIGEGQRRLAHLERYGPTAWAFNFRRSFPAVPNAIPLGDIGDGRAAPESYRLCG
ncbi:MAG: DUF3291 domain-containing protein [Dongiaceae bacterium]